MPVSEARLSRSVTKHRQQKYRRLRQERSGGFGLAVMRLDLLLPQLQRAEIVDIDPRLCELRSAKLPSEWIDRMERSRKKQSSNQAPDFKSAVSPLRGGGGR